MSWFQVLLLVHAGATLCMTGVIWFVQVVHYPLLDRVGRDGYPTYQREHERRTTLVVAPLMLLEAASAVLLLWPHPWMCMPWLPWVGGALLLLIWLSTAVLQVPAHHELGSGFDPATHRRLVLTNWVRTWAWSVRGLLALLLLQVA